MAYHFNDNVYTKSFTPREYQVELLDAAKRRNIIVCLGSGPGKIFIATKLIQELANVVRKPWRGGGKRTLYVVDTPALVIQQAAYIRHLTDLRVGEYKQNGENEEEEVWSVDWESEFEKHQVLVMTSSICLQVFQCNFLTFSDVNLIVFDECHRAVRNHPMQQIMHGYDKCSEKPRILGLTAPLLNNTCDPGRLEGEIRRLELSLQSTAETASDIVSVLRYCTKPKESLVEYGLPVAGLLDFILEEQVQHVMEYINDHRYDPSEVYDEEFQEELKAIPDPKVDPLKICNDFLDVLHTLGPWCADRAALVLLIHLEKLKVKTPYERHFLLLCMVSTVMVKIRAICDHAFQEYEEKERVYKLSSPKVLRLLEVLRQFRPTKVPEDKGDISSSNAKLPDNKDKDNSSSDSKAILLEIESSSNEHNKEKSDSSNSKTEVASIAAEDQNEEKDYSKAVLSENAVSASIVEQKKEKSESNSTIITLDSEKKSSGGDDNNDDEQQCCETNRNNSEDISESIDKCRGVKSPIQDANEISSDVSCDNLIMENHSIVNTNETFSTESTALCHSVTKDENIDEIQKSKEDDCDRNIVSVSIIKNINKKNGLCSVHHKSLNSNEISRSCSINDKTVINYDISEDKSPIEITVKHAIPDKINVSEDRQLNNSAGNINDGTVINDDNDDCNGAGNCDDKNTAVIQESTKLAILGKSNVSENRHLDFAENERDAKSVIENHNDKKSLVTQEDTKLEILDKSIISEENQLNNAENEMDSESVIEHHNDKSRVTQDGTKHEILDKSISEDNQLNNAANSKYDETDDCKNDSSDSRVLLSGESISTHGDEHDRKMNKSDSANESTGIGKENSEDDSKKQCCETSSNNVVHNSMEVALVDKSTSSDADKQTNRKHAINDKKCEAKQERGKPEGSTPTNIRNYGGRGRGPRYNKRYFREDASGKTIEVPFRHHRNLMQDDADALCGIIFVENRFTAKILYHLLNDVRHCDENFSFLAAQYTVDKVADPITDPREAEVEHRKQEEVLKRFRMRECNLLVGTSVLEEGIDIPKCNLVVLFDLPSSYRSYVQCKGRARAQEAHFVMLVAEYNKASFIRDLARYYEIEQMLLRKCANREPPESEEVEADKYTDSIEAYRPSNSPTGASVNMATAVALVNRYCAKLPSDTFTRLTPLYSMKRLKTPALLYQCTLRLPINSPVKQDILGLPMPSRVLARRVAALEACRLLHKAQELDDNLLPVGKEGFRVPEEEEDLTLVEEDDSPASRDASEPRPGTTKRRQYYYKRIADALTDCRPTPGRPAYLYSINMVLTCPLPEEQNTRGRKIYPPEDSVQGFGILTLKPIPTICPFPIFTRSGEVRVTLVLSLEKVILTEDKIDKIVTFLNYTFTSVLRLQKYLMMFDPQASENSYFIVPTKADKDSSAEVDWDFLDRIYENRDLRPKPVPQEERVLFSFDAAKYHDAVIMPWYRNQDQPQYFYVAEICAHLNPKSSFPGSEYKTFDEYYFKKYNIQIQNSKQPLLDVDHTSARLNFLTPRYVNRKGVALPTSSEETKRAKRENLEQKQILVPELCTVHPFPASLWRKAVCLPCILYRINALLLADQIRCQVAASVGLGMQQLALDFDWPPLDFGWSLADVLKKSKENAAKNMLKENGETNEVETLTSEFPKRDDKKEEDDGKKKEMKEDDDNPDSEEKERKKKSANEILTEEEKKLRGSWMEIGTWSNEMADQQPKMFDIPIDDFDPNVALPANLTLLGEDVELAELHSGASDWGTGISARRRERVRYGSPSSWMGFGGMGGGFRGLEQYLEGFETDDSCSEPGNDFDQSDSSEIQGTSGLRIEFKSDNVAEAVEDEQEAQKRERRLAKSSDANSTDSEIPWDWDQQSMEEEDDELEKLTLKFQEQFERATEENEKHIRSSGVLLKKDDAIIVTRRGNHVSQVMNVFMEVLPQRLDRSHADLTQTLTQNQQADFIAGEKVIFLSLKKASYEAVELGTDSGFSEDEGRIPRTDPLVSNTDIADMESEVHEDSFSFDEQPDLEGHAGPSPSIILQALTMSNANDGINLERLETIGDSFLKYAITTYLYCTYDNIHEGKLSHLRSKQVSNLNLYRLGRRKVFGESMIATKFEPHDNWLPPCYYVPRELEQALIEAGVPASHWNRADLPALRDMTRDQINAMVKERGEQLRALAEGEEPSQPTVASTLLTTATGTAVESLPCFIPYNLITQHSIPDKSVADCVEALIGAYLIACGPRGALLFMAWLGICVLPKEEVVLLELPEERVVGSLPLVKVEDEVPTTVWKQVQYGNLKAPRSPLLRNIPNPEGELERLLDGYDEFEKNIGYRFLDRSYLLQALTHASYSPNRLTDCYQRLEFLGDAVLDYLITRHLYEDSRQHSPGALTDLRSALVNNTIFASLAVRHGFHKFFRHLSPGLNDVVNRFVRIQEDNGHTISEQCYLIEEEECEEAEDVEVPKALGDVFESVAGAIFLDSNMSLDAVWRVYYRMMKGEIEQFSTNVPKSPIRELLELEPETAKFGKPEKLADGRRVRVSVEVFGKGTFKGIGRNYRIAKCTAAKCALKQLKKKGLLSKKM